MMDSAKLSVMQINWAKQHDWFYADLMDGRIIVLDRYTQLQADGSVTSHEDSIIWTQGFSALRNWAGY
jgi:hypothetical protein